MLHVSRLVWVLLPGLLTGCCCAGVVSGLVGRLLLDGGTPMAPPLRQMVVALCRSMAVLAALITLLTCGRALIKGTRPETAVYTRRIDAGPSRSLSSFRSPFAIAL